MFNLKKKQAEGLNNPTVENARNKKPHKKIALKLLIVILFLAGYAGAYYFYDQYRAIKVNPNIEAQKETELLVVALGKLMELPTDETPTVATILDKEKLKDQLFFQTAENNDKLLVYAKATKAILYRPKTNKIINVGPVNLNENTAQTQTEQIAQTNEIKVAYYNGTQTIGLSVNAEKIVKEKFDNFKTVTIENASKTDYKETIVVDFSGKYNKEATEIAELLNGKVGSMPEGEVAPDADILVISGK